MTRLLRLSFANVEHVVFSSLDVSSTKQEDNVMKSIDLLVVLVTLVQRIGDDTIRTTTARLCLVSLVFVVAVKDSCTLLSALDLSWEITTKKYYQ